MPYFKGSYGRVAGQQFAQRREAGPCCAVPVAQIAG